MMHCLLGMERAESNLLGTHGLCPGQIGVGALDNISAKGQAMGSHRQLAFGNS